MRIGIAGIDGRMGRLLAQAVPQSGAILAGGIGRGGDLAALAAGCDVVIDFTLAATAIAHAEILAPAGVAWVLGTTGRDAAGEAAVAAAAQRVAVCASPNFSVGVTVLLSLAERLAASLPAAEYDADVLETHHRQKRDAPSGTARALVTALGPRPVGTASLRAGQIVGDHTLRFTSALEQIEVTHRALDRAVFATGAVQAALWLRGRLPGLYTMRDVLGL